MRGIPKSAAVIRWHVRRLARPSNKWSKIPCDRCRLPRGFFVGVHVKKSRCIALEADVHGGERHAFRKRQRVEWWRTLSPFAWHAGRRTRCRENVKSLAHNIRRACRHFARRATIGYWTCIRNEGGALSSPGRRRRTGKKQMRDGPVCCAMPDGWRRRAGRSENCTLPARFPRRRITAPPPRARPRRVSSRRVQSIPVSKPVDASLLDEDTAGHSVRGLVRMHMSLSVF